MFAEIQEIQKKRVAEYLQASFAETNALREEMRSLQTQARLNLWNGTLMLTFHL